MIAEIGDQVVFGNFEAEQLDVTPDAGVEQPLAALMICFSVSDRCAWYLPVRSHRLKIGTFMV